ncbi:unnamed protein product [Ambrosiozyma monospora]|uniref:Unnamed protein product n=1 Tax=Ambrosiozyma monospora TaxID=43982 RepID=A0ACB5T4X9_AMBMO|nr:unnamed protein product [Ambrosiozyma monospora]
MPGMPMDPMDQQGAAMYMSAPGQMPPPPIGYFAGPPQAYGPNGSPTNPPVGAAAAVTQAFNDPNNTTVFVGGLSSVVTEDTLMTLFEQFGQIIHVKVPPGKGCGFVKFTRRENAEQAIAGMQGFIIGGSRIRLSWGRSNNRNQQQQQMIMAAAAANPLSRASFDFASAVQVQQLQPNLTGHGRQPAPGQAGIPVAAADGSVYPPTTPQAAAAGLVGIPAGMPAAPMFYDPYFGSAPPPTGAQGQNQSGPQQGGNGGNRGLGGLDGNEFQQQQQQLGVPSMGGVGVGLGGMPGGVQQGGPPPPQTTFAIDQNGQYMYLAPQPFPAGAAMMSGAAVSGAGSGDSEGGFNDENNSNA